jgi:hypothetical protein
MALHSSLCVITLIFIIQNNRHNDIADVKIT